MADTKFSTKNIKLIPTNGYSSIDCDSTIEINVPNYLNLNADTVAISTDISIGGRVSSDLIISNGFFVGVGTTNPTTKFHVNGNAQIGTIQFSSGIITATSYVGSGSSLTGLTGASAGTYGSASQVAQITVDSNNRITSISNVNVSASIVGINTTGTSVFNNLNVSGVSTAGIITGSTYYGDASNVVTGRWVLGANGASDYTFTGVGFPATTNDPILYLARGRVYEFVNNSGGAHPFQIRVSNGGAAYNDGVTNNGASSGTIRFEVPFNAPNSLYYQCTNHASMGNTIVVYPSV